MSVIEYVNGLSILISNENFTFNAYYLEITAL